MMTSRQPETGRVAIVTGAARRIGAAVARHLHARGMNVLVHHRHSTDAAEALVAELETARPGSARGFTADLAEARSPGRIVSATLEAFGRVDVLVNNASGFYPTALDQATPAQWDDLMASNLKAPFFLTVAAAEALRAAGGAVVNLADIHGRTPLKHYSIYSQAKAGLIMQTRALARELAPRVRVNAVAPGTILWPENDAAQDTAGQNDILRRVPLGRQGTPQDIAGAVAFLALDAPYITGQVLAVDGGRSLRL